MPVDHTRSVPEGLEVELYRRTAVGAIGRVVARVVVDDSLAPPDFADAVASREFTSADRVGKLLLLGTDGPTVGLHFGMTGRLVLDGAAPIERLELRQPARRARVGIGCASSSPTAGCCGSTIRGAGRASRSTPTWLRSGRTCST